MQIFSVLYKSNAQQFTNHSFHPWYLKCIFFILSSFTDFLLLNVIFERAQKCLKKIKIRVKVYFSFDTFLF